MIPVKLSEDKYEEMTVEVDLAIIKGSPLEQDSTLSAATDDDDSRHGLVIAGTHDEAAIAEKSEEIIATESMCADERKPKQKVSKTTFPCEVCCKVFLKRSRLSSHMIVHTEEKEFICSICNKGFKNKPQLQRHSNTHSAAPNFCCNICGRGFKHNDVAKHIKRFHSGPRKTRRGGVANPKAPSSSPFGAQPILQHDPCEAVPQSVYHQNQSSLHLPAPQSVIIPNQSSNKMIQLQPDHETLLNHKNDNTNQDFVLNSEHTITQNQSFGLGIPEMIPVEGSDNGRTHIFMSSQSLHGCSDCPESFTNQSALANHVLSHTHSVEDQKRSSSKAGKNRHQCPMCLKTFTRATGLAGHLHLHNRSERRRQPNPNFCCPMCGKTFIRRTGLNGHILQHSGVLRFWCDEPDCGKGFVHSYQLTRHKRLHSGILPYSCQVCGRSFRHNDLTKHMRTHTGAKPYNCCHCGKAFAFTSSLRTHERMHLALKEHICEICNIGFTTSAGLQRHIKCHEDDSQILCPSCGKLFLSKLHFGMHLQESLLCAGHQQQKVQQPSQDLTEQLLCQVHAEQNQNLQVLPTTHLQHHELSEIPANAMAEIRSTDSLSIHVNSHHQLPQQGDTPLLAALAPSEVEPVISEHIPQLASKNSGTVPVLVPFSMSVPVSVPFGLSLNSNHSEQLQMNHFLTWGEQKYCVDQ